MKWARLLALAGIVLAVSLLPLAGLPEPGASSGQDAPVALLWLDGFSGQMAAGHWWPPWLPSGNRGFGSPAFLFYPPLSYWVAADLGFALHLPPADALLVAAALWRAGAAVLAYLWLRTRLGTEAALVGAALFSLHPQNMLVNPLVGFAYAELAGTCLLLAGLIAAGTRRKLLWVPPAFALLALTHLPTAILAGAVLPGWSLVVAGWRAALLTLAGCILGAALAAVHLAPALLLLPEINQAGWDTGGLTTWPGHFLFDRWTPSKPLAHFIFMNAGLALVLAALAALWLVGRRAVPPQRDALFRRGTLLLLVLCLLVTPLSWPVWAALPPLQRVQFPWRLMVPVTAIWAMLMAWRFERLASAGQAWGGRAMAVAGLLMAVTALWLPYSALTEDRPAFARLDWSRLHFGHGGPGSTNINPPEFATRAAAAAGWDPWNPATDAPLHAALARSRVPGVAVSREADGAMRVRGEAASGGSLLLPQFAFPGWALSPALAGAGLATDAATGLLRLDLPAGKVDLAVAHAATPPERIGALVSLLALAGWLLLARRSETV